jgi:hypothetical protein
VSESESESAVEARNVGVPILDAEMTVLDRDDDERRRYTAEKRSATYKDGRIQLFVV